MKIQRFAAIVAVVFGFASHDASASTLQQTFTNDYASNAIYLFADNPVNLSFTSATFSGGASGWSLTVNTGDELAMSGTVLTPGSGLFNVTFNYTSLPFSFQWAEVLTGTTTNTVLGSGTLNWNGSGWSTNSAFTHLSAINPASPVPVPAPIWLLGSALVGLICIGRRSHSPK